MNKINIPININIHERLKQIDQMTRQLEIILQMPLKNHIWPLLKHKQLVLLTNNSQIASQARFMQNEICKELSQKLAQPIKKIKIRMVAIEATWLNHKSRNDAIRQDTKDVVCSIATEIEDKELAQLLTRLTQGRGQRE